MDKLKSLLGNKLVIRSAILLAIAVAGVNLPAEQVDQLANVLALVLGLFAS
jgi:hypothetical protein